MPQWTAFPHLGQYRFTADSVSRHWLRLHAGDAEPLPADECVVQAWVLLHNGDFEGATAAGLAAGGRGVTVQAPRDANARPIDAMERLAVELARAELTE